MLCSLDKKQISALYSKVFKSVIKSFKNNSFDLRDQILSIYNLIKDNSNHENGLLWSSYVPELIFQSLNRTKLDPVKIFDQLDTKELAQLINSFKEGGLNKVAEYLSLDIDDTKIIEENELEKSDINSKINQGTPPVKPDLTSEHGTLSLNPYSPLTSAGHENKKDENGRITNEQNKELSHIYSFIREMVYQSVEYNRNASKNYYKLHSGFRFKAVKSSSLDTSKMNESEKAELESSDIALVVTDNDGNILYFGEHEANNKSETGKIVFQMLRTFEYDKNGNAIFRRYKPMSINDYAYRKDISIEEATEIRNKDLEVLNGIMTDVANGKEPLLEITGGTAGLLIPDFEQTVDLLEPFKAGKLGDFNIRIGAEISTERDLSNNVLKPGHIYMKIPGVEKLIYLTSKPYSQKDLEDLANYLFTGDDSVTTKQNMLETLIYMHRVKVNRTKGGLKLNDTKFDFTPENKQAFLDYFKDNNIKAYYSVTNAMADSNFASKIVYDDTLDLYSLKSISIEEYIIKNFTANTDFNLINGHLFFKLRSESNIENAEEKQKEVIKSNKSTRSSFLLPIEELNPHQIGSKEFEEFERKRKEGKLPFQRKGTDKPSKSIKERLHEIRNKKNKLNRSKKLGQVTIIAENEKKAQNWFSKTFGNKVSYTRLDHIVNSDAFATFTKHGVILYNGSSYIDLYHESWHVFTQMFLTIDEKISLYSNLQKQKGSFVDHNGNKIKFKDASYLQLEEFLAEDFRNYKLNNSKSIIAKSAKGRNIFKKIYDFLKTLFGHTSTRDFFINRSTASNVYKLFVTLDKGQLSNYNFSEQNILFDDLNRSKRAKTLDGDEFPIAISNRIKKVFDSIYIDYINSQVNRGNYNIPLTDSDGTLDFYTYALDKIISIHDNLSNLYNEILADSDSSTDELFQLERNISLLNDIISNYGNLNKKSIASKDNGLISFHLSTTKIIDQDDIKLDKIEESINDNNEDEDNIQQKRLQSEGNDKSIIELASDSILHILSTIPAIDKITQNPIVSDFLGLYEPEKFATMFAIVANATVNSTDEIDMYNKLVDLSKNDIRIQFLLDKLGDIHEDDINIQSNWSKFYRTFDKRIVKYIHLNLNINTKQDDLSTGETILDTETTSLNIQNNSGNINPIIKSWKSYSLSTNNVYIQDGKLDIERIINDFFINNELIEGQEINFLNAIGIYLSNDETISKIIANKTSSNKQKINFAISSIANYLYRIYYFNENGGNIELNPVTSYLNNSLSSPINKQLNTSNISKSFKAQYEPSIKSHKYLPNISNAIMILANLELKYGTDEIGFSVLTAANKLAYESYLTNSITRVITKLNNAKHYSEILNDPSLEFLNIYSNPAIKYNFVLRNLFNLDVNSDNFGKRLDKSILIENANGIIYTQDRVNSVIGEETKSLIYRDKLVFDFYNMMLHGTVELQRHGTKFSPIALRLNKLEDDYKNPWRHLYIEPKDLYVKSNILNRKSLQEIRSILLSELQSIKTVLDDPTTYDRIHKFGENRKRIQIFDNILLSTKDKILKRLKSEDPISILKDMSDKINLDINNYFNRKTDELQSENIHIDDNLINITIKTLPILSKEDINQDEIKKLLLKTYAVNYFIHTAIMNDFAHGDIANYDIESKDEFPKRSGGSTSGGNSFRHSIDFINHLESKYGGKLYEKSIASKLGIEHVSQFSPILNIAVVKNSVQKSVRYNQYVKQKIDYLIKKLNAKTKAEKDKIRADVIKEFEPYAKLTENDGQGYITFDMYRLLSLAEDKWNNEQEELFRKIVNGEDISDYNITKIFPPKKFQYFGRLLNVPLSVTAYHKYSLVPLIPGMYDEKSNMDILHKKMIKENLTYVIPESASKLAHIKNKDNETDNFYEGEDRILSTKPYTKNKIHLVYLKDVTHVPNKFKRKTIFSTQLRKLSFLNTFNNGVPVDVSEKDSEKWDSYTHDEKIAKSNLYKRHYNYLTFIDELTSLHISAIKKEAGWEIDENGKTIKKPSIKKLAKFIIDKLEQLDYNEFEIDHIIVSKAKLVHDLSLSPSASKLEKAILSIANNNVIRQKVNGESLVQVANTGFEKPHKFRKLTKVEEAKYETATNELSFYQYDKDNDVVKPMEIMIAISGQFKRLLKVKHNDGKEISTIDRLNEMIKDETWLNTRDNKKLITLVGVRIPDQYTNSVEVMQIAKFLPESAGNIIVLPSEIVAKAGSDFDIDKLTTFFPNYTEIDGDVKILRNYNDEKSDISSNYPKSSREIYKSYKAEVIRVIRDYMIEDKQSKKKINSILNRKNTLDKIFKEFSILYSPKLLDNLLNKNKIKTITQYKKKFNPIRIKENDIMNIMIEQILDSRFFFDLITPNSTSKWDPVVEKMKSIIPRYTGKTPNGMHTATALFEPRYNALQHIVNFEGNALTGIAAVGNVYHQLFSTTGLTVEKPLFLLEKKSETTKVGKQMSEDGSYNINEVIGQFINGTVDVESNPWISDLRINESNLSTLVYLLEAGVNIELAVKFINIPIIKEYFDNLGLVKSPLNKIYNKDSIKKNLIDNINFAKKNKETKDQFYKDQRYIRFASPSQLSSLFEQMIISNTSDDIMSLVIFNEFINNINPAANDLTTVRINTRFDTVKTSSSAAVINRYINIEKLLSGELTKSIDIHDIRKLIDNTILKSFDINDFQSELLSRLFKLRMNTTLISKIRDIENLNENKILYIQEMFTKYIIQKSLKHFELKEGSVFKDKKIKIDNSIESTVSINNESNEIIVNLDKLKTEYTERHFLNKSKSEDSYRNKGLAVFTNIKYFKTFKEYAAFVLNRELIRSTLDISNFSRTIEYRILRNQFIDLILKDENESDQEFNENFTKRMYEVFLRNEALLNSLNISYIFGTIKGYISDLKSLMREISRNDPKILDEYAVLKTLKTFDNKKDLISFITTNSYTDDSDVIAEYNDQLIKLIEPSTVISEDPILNYKIHKLFSNIPAVLFLQDGSKSTRASFNRFLSTRSRAEMIKDQIDEIIDIFNNDPLLEDKFMKYFVSKISNKLSKDILNSSRFVDFTLYNDIQDFKSNEPSEQRKKINVEKIKGENITSKGSEFAKKLTNPGNNLTVEYKGKTFRNAEHAYQTWKSGKFDESAYNSKAFKPKGKLQANKSTLYQTMVDILTAKLQQHPELVKGINDRGGIEYLNNSTHEGFGNKFWEGKDGGFMRALKEAYLKQAKTNRDNVKASIANKYIGFGEGIAKSPTEHYRQQVNKSYNKAIEEVNKRPNTSNIPQNLQSGKKKYRTLQYANKEAQQLLGKNVTSIELILNGFRTRTTRTDRELLKYNIKVGDYIKMFGKDQYGNIKNVIVKITNITKGYDDATWYKEGWTREGLKKLKEHTNTANAIEFVVIHPANPSNYSPNDIIFVSIVGKEGDKAIRKQQQDKTIKEALKAIEAGATLITNNKFYIKNSTYSEGEKRLAAALEAKGYYYSEYTIDKQILGVWNKNIIKANVLNETIDRHTKSYSQILDDIKEENITSYNEKLDQTPTEESTLKNTSQTIAEKQLSINFSNVETSQIQSINKLFNPNDKTLKKGSVVRYNGKLYLFWNKNKSNKAQLITIEGNKFSGTPLLDKLTIEGSYPTVIFNGTEYIVTDKENIYSGATGKLVYTGTDNSSINIKNRIIEQARNDKNNEDFETPCNGGPSI